MNIRQMVLICKDDAWEEFKSSLGTDIGNLNSIVKTAFEKGVEFGVIRCLRLLESDGYIKLLEDTTKRSALEHE